MARRPFKIDMDRIEPPIQQFWFRRVNNEIIAHPACAIEGPVPLSGYKGGYPCRFSMLWIFAMEHHAVVNIAVEHFANGS